MSDKLAASAAGSPNKRIVFILYCEPSHSCIVDSAVCGAGLSPGVDESSRDVLACLLEARRPQMFVGIIPGNKVRSKVWGHAIDVNKW